MFLFLFLSVLTLQRFKGGVEGREKLVQGPVAVDRVSEVRVRESIVEKIESRF